MNASLLTFKQRIAALPLQAKFVLLILTAVLLPLLFFVLTFTGEISELVRSGTIVQTQQSVSSAAPEISGELTRLTDGADTIAREPLFRSLFYMPLPKEPKALLQGRDAQSFFDCLDSLEAEGLIRKACLYIDLPDEDPFFDPALSGDRFYPLSRAKGRYWYGILSDGKVKELFCPPIYEGPRERREMGDLSYIRAYTVYVDGEPRPAYLALYYSSALLLEKLNKVLGAEPGVSYILTEREDLVVATDPALCGLYYVDYEDIESAFYTSNGFLERETAGGRVFAGYYRILPTRWFLVTVLPSSLVSERSRAVLLRFILVFVSALILTLTLVLVLTHSITDRISKVIAQMSLIKEGPPLPMRSPEYNDEIGELVDTYNYMVWRINRLMEEQKETLEDLRLAEFSSLQAQINPHFLYNTMDMIHWLAVQGRTEEISDAVRDLSRFYRLTLSRKESIATLAEELEHITLYVRLQNMRFNDGISLIIDVPDELTDCQIPRLTLQPLVENAILHGILETEKKEGTIVVTGWSEGEDLLLIVSDDGQGIEPALLSGLLKASPSPVGRGNSIAVANTHRRLELLYGSGYGLRYESAPGQGCDVEIRLPQKSRKPPSQS